MRTAGCLVDWFDIRDLEMLFRGWPLPLSLRIAVVSWCVTQQHWVCVVCFVFQELKGPFCKIKWRWKYHLWNELIIIWGVKVKCLLKPNIVSTFCNSHEQYFLEKCKHIIFTTKNNKNTSDHMQLYTYLQLLNGYLSEKLNPCMLQEQNTFTWKKRAWSNIHFGIRSVPVLSCFSQTLSDWQQTFSQRTQEVSQSPKQTVYGAFPFFSLWWS